MAEDVKRAEGKLQQCMQSLITHQFVDLQQKIFPALERHMKQIQTANDVVIVKKTPATSSYTCSYYSCYPYCCCTNICCVAN